MGEVHLVNIIMDRSQNIKLEFSIPRKDFTNYLQYCKNNQNNSENIPPELFKLSFNFLMHLIYNLALNSQYTY